MIEKILKDNIIVASILEKYLGLKPNYFAKKKYSNVKSFTKELDIFKMDTVIMVSVPPELKKYLSEYKAMLLNIREDESEFDYIFKLDKYYKIGFWR